MGNEIQFQTIRIVCNNGMIPQKPKENFMKKLLRNFLLKIIDLDSAVRKYESRVIKTEIQATEVETALTLKIEDLNRQLAKQRAELRELDEVVDSLDDDENEENIRDHEKRIDKLEDKVSDLEDCDYDDLDSRLETLEDQELQDDIDNLREEFTSTAADFEKRIGELEIRSNPNDSNLAEELEKQKEINKQLNERIEKLEDAIKLAAIGFSKIGENL